MRTGRAIAVAGVVVLAACSLAGCQEGRGSMTALEYSIVTGVQLDVGQMALRDVYVVPANGTDITPGGSAYLRMTLVNDGISTDVLTGISVRGATATVVGSAPSPSPTLGSPLPSAKAQFPSPGASNSAFPKESTPKPAGSVQPAGPEGFPATTAPSPSPVNTPITVAPGQVVQFGTGGGGAQILLSGFRSTVHSGGQITVTFTFRDAGSLDATIPVYPLDGTTATATPVPTSSS